MHIPVLLNEMIENLIPQDGGVYFDGTFGGGGYSKAILDIKGTKVFSIDRDLDAGIRANCFKEFYKDRFDFLNIKFSQINEFFPKEVIFDGAVFDFGPSSFHFDDGDRGFSFRFDGPLDMRMSPNDQLTAYEVINTFSEDDLFSIIFNYGEEKNAKKIVKAIIKNRPLKTTFDLKNIIHSVTVNKIPGYDPSTQTFQAIRIYVNDEFNEMEKGIKSIVPHLKIGSKLILVTFHGLEEKVVKNTTRGLKSVFKQPLKPTKNEVFNNKRSRSAKMRVFVIS